MAFLCGLAIKVSLNFRPTYGRMRKNLPQWAAVSYAAIVFAGGFGLLVWAWDPLWCQRVPTVVGLVGLLFYAEEALTRSDYAASLRWPFEEMASCWPALTRMLVGYHLFGALLNEAMIALLPLWGWLLFWAAVLPVVLHFVHEGMVTLTLYREKFARGP